MVLWLIFRPASARSLPTIERNPGEDRQEIALAPPANPAPKAEQQPEQPQPQPQQQEQPQPKPEPPKKATPLGPDSKNPDALVPKEAGPEKPPIDPDQMNVNKPEPPTKVETPPAEPEAAPTQAPKGVRRIATVTDLGEAMRAKGLFDSKNDKPRDILTAGTRNSNAEVAAAAGMMGRVGPTQPDYRDWRPSFPEAAGKCVEIPDLGKNPDGTPVLATVIGRVLADDQRSPLAGAHLQIVGTPFSTFSNANGEYRLEFDPKLLERCRVQYVRVAREGFSGQLLTLAIGERITSDDVVLRRR
ncbi:MAG: hypothetical protein V9E87_16610 [Gemmatimonadales bacterium]